MASDVAPESSNADDGAGLPIDEDLYCLYCGYNLRGLSGNPVRCPECGKFNDRVLIAIPAPLIHQALSNMETAPSMCVGVFLVAVLIAFLLLALGKFATAAILAMLAGLLWLPPYLRMKSNFDNRIGWRAILRDFHLATVLWVAPLFWMIHVLTAFRPPVQPPLLYILTYVIAPGAFVLGMIVYRNAQKRIDELQRDKAVFMARHLLRKELTFDRERESPLEN